VGLSLTKDIGFSIYFIHFKRENFVNVAFDFCKLSLQVLDLF